MTRLPRLVIWILSATVCVAAQSCAPDQERVPDTPREDDPGGRISATEVDASSPSLFPLPPVTDRRLAVGDTIQGELTVSDPIRDGGRIEVWELAADAGQRLRVDVQSEDFDAVLYVVGPGLGTGPLDASLCLTPESAEGYRLVVAGRNEEVGRYALSVAPAPQPNDCFTDGRLSVGDTIQGELTGSDPIRDGDRIEVWELAADAGQRLRVDVQSEDFDAVLYVVGPGLGTGLRDDDGGFRVNGPLDASLCFTPEGAEGYRLVAAALDEGTGRYTLSATPARLGDCGYSHDEFLVVADSLGSLLADSARVLRIDDVVEDALGPGMGTLDGFRGSAWRFDAPPAPGRVRIDMRSVGGGDALLYVSGPGLPDGLADRGARLCFTPSAATGYRVVAAALGWNPDRRFTLRVRRERSEGSCGGLRSRPAPEGNRVAEGRMVAGALDFEGVGAWSLVAEPGRRVRVDVQSDDFDPVLHVFGPGPADSLYDDDGGEGGNARVCFAPSQADGHRVVVTWQRNSARSSYMRRGDDGAYTLSVNAADGPQCGTAADASSDRAEPEASAVAEVSGDGLWALSDGNCTGGCSVVCVAGEEPTVYESVVSFPCSRTFLQVGSDEHMEIRYRVTDENATNPYDRGYRELLRYRDGRVIETLPLRQPSDVAWSMTPFVRIRRQQYLADLDGDGHLEFAVVPYSPGSAFSATARIYSLRDEIEPWGEGVLLIEHDSFVRLDCMACSRFNPEKCGICR